MENISLPTIKRLPTYYNLICNILKTGKEYTSSSFISDILGIDDTLVRKDMSSVGCLGKPRLGYNLQELKEGLEKFLGFNDQKNAVIIGAGNLGTALAKYENFKKYGLNIIAIFDRDPHKIDLIINGIKVFDLLEMECLCKDNNIEIAILTVPGKFAQSVTNSISNAGIKTIWNFSPANLSVPEDSFVWNQDLVSSFLTLSKLSEINKHKSRTLGS